jgi:hypothetical protein
MVDPGYDTETFEYDNLVVGDEHIISDRETLILGQNLTRGAALGKITASGNLTQLDSGAVDGSENPFAILMEDCDATLANTACSVYLKGEFNQNEIGFVTGDTFATFKDAFRAISIFLKDSLAE